MIGRETNKIRLEVCKGTQITHIQPLIEDRTAPTVCLNTDESSAYNRVKESGRKHQTVCHSKKEFTRDENKDGKCEVHGNRAEGLWTGLCNFCVNLEELVNVIWRNMWLFSRIIITLTKYIYNGCISNLRVL